MQRIESNGPGASGFPTTRVCAQTKRQLGWRDANDNGVIEPLDAPPT